ncbi:AbrB/MazE/SpoVT family DNA-binding domain-containing protein [Candidatus Saccharibacteria bacterium]|nr:AbrB/MazE/SpoVT family DNA-binding domain-containing protein [Candidatus Saccharibacteria bacterium]
MQLKEINMGQAATLTKTGQITIPKWVREYLDVKPGQAIIFRKEKDGMKIMREKTAEETAEAIRKLIPEEARRRYIEKYGGMTAAEVREKWSRSPEGRAYLQAEEEKCL